MAVVNQETGDSMLCVSSGWIRLTAGIHWGALGAFQNGEGAGGGGEWEKRQRDMSR